MVNGDVYKTNFWEVAFQAYDPFYPPGVLAAFYDPNNPANNVDIGLPVPDVERLYLGDGQLHATQQAMPGLNNPYILNEAQTFQEHFTDFPFFINFPFGYVADNVNWFEAAGVPIAMFDDFGRENPYPLVRVQAKQGAATIASLDTVMPISGEAECQSCHAAPGGRRQRLGHQEPRPPITSRSTTRPMARCPTQPASSGPATSTSCACMTRSTRPRCSRRSMRPPAGPPSPWSASVATTPRPWTWPRWVRTRSTAATKSSTSPCPT